MCHPVERGIDEHSTSGTLNFPMMEGLSPAQLDSKTAELATVL